MFLLWDKNYHRSNYLCNLLPFKMLVADYWMRSFSSHSVKDMVFKNLPVTESEVQLEDSIISFLFLDSIGISMVSQR